MTSFINVLIGVYLKNDLANDLLDEKKPENIKSQ